jgi:hypothetical protein
MSPSRLLEDKFLEQKESQQQTLLPTGQNKTTRQTSTEANLQHFKRRTVTDLIRDLPGELIRLQIATHDQPNRRKSYTNLLLLSYSISSEETMYHHRTLTRRSSGPRRLGRSHRRDPAPRGCCRCTHEHTWTRVSNGTLFVDSSRA